MAATQAQLDEARAAYHRIQTGTAVTEFVDQNGERVRYQMANVGGLERYIRSLEVALGLSLPNVAAPIRFLF